jgi:sortase A
MNNDNPNNDQTKSADDAAIDLIRQKLNRLYNNPKVLTPGNINQPKVYSPHPQSGPQHPPKEERPSVHQMYMKSLTSSGKLVSEIQTEWHNYYLGLSDAEKREVWDEFYRNNSIEGQPIDHPQEFQEIIHEGNPTDELKKKRKIKKPISKKRHLFRSIAFGLSIGILCIVIFLFGFFNQVIIAPFITPSKNLSVDSIIVTNGTVNISPNPVIIIPKINVEIPVIYNVQGSNESQIEGGLQLGVVHYSDTAYPGQNGNGVIFGHSAGNIFSPGLYKYAFSLLHYLQVGDTFTINYQSKSYTYQIFAKFVVAPTDVSVMDPIAGHAATFTLITCDPPGFSTNRLIIQADQINPNPALNSVTAAPISVSSLPTTLPSQSPSLWSKFLSWF